MNLLKSVFVLFLSITLIMPAAYGQAKEKAKDKKEKAAPVQRVKSYEPIATGTRRRLSGIIFTGLGGAVLGLSTLSFHGRPQDHLQNIAIGFALGVIAGTLLTTYKAVQEPYEEYERDQGYSLLEDSSFTELNSQKVSHIEPSISLKWAF